MRRCMRVLLGGSLLFAGLAGSAVLAADETADDARHEPIFSYDSLHQPVMGKAGMVVTQNGLATEVGAAILEQGGNAIDAAVAVGFALAVTLPRAGNIGGGGFMTAYLADDDHATVIDYREVAPSAATRETFLDEHGKANPDLARFGHLAVAVPGSVAGFALAHERYGSLSWATLLEPAIRLAEEGFAVTPYLADALLRYEDWLQEDPATAAVFYPDGRPLGVGDTLVQEDLAWTLGRIRDAGADGFYAGAVAEKIVAEMEVGNGLITHEDLANYRALETEPVKGSYRGYDIVSVSPPSSGGVHLVQMLNILEEFALPAMGYGGADSIHVMAETMKLAYADRSKHIADPRFADVPVGGLTSKDYADELRPGIDLKRARPSEEIHPGDPLPYESTDTTHFSIADAMGNVVSNTYTLNYSFGAGLMVDGTGILLNNEMDDFGLEPGVPDSYGLLAAPTSFVEGGKRPVSSMSPTIVFRDGKPFLVVGTPGGSHIITAVLQTIVNVLDHGLNIAEAIHRPRFHHQWQPNRLQMEAGFSPDTIELLTGRGHEVELLDWASCSVQAILLEDGLFFGGADPRRPDARAIGVDSATRNPTSDERGDGE